MSEKQTRGTAALAILQLLKHHTDENHTLSQNKIKEILSSEYGMNVNRKTISRNLSRLIEYGFPIQFQGKDIPEDEIIRKSNNGEEELIMTNWYYDHEFTKGELRLLIDNAMFTSALPKRYRKELITKLERLSSKYFSFEMPKVDMEIDNRIQNNDIIITYENIGYAIANEKQLGFFYCDYKTDGKLHPRTHTDGFKKQYIVNPYQILSMNGHPYLICNLPQYDDLTHFRLDRIKDSRVMMATAKPLRKLRGFETGMRLSEYLGRASEPLERQVGLCHSSV